MPSRQKSPECSSVRRNPIVLEIRLRCAENITDAAQRMDQLHIEILVHLVPQPADQDVDHICLRIEGVIPELLEQIGLGKRLPCVAHQMLEQRKLAWLQL